MPLQLKTPPASRGMRWIADGWRVFIRRPLAMTLMFLAFLLVWALVSRVLPFVGSLLQLMSLPLLSLGYMIATQSALLDGPVHPGQFIEPLRAEAKRRNSLLLLCAVYGALALAILLVCSWISNDAMTRLQDLIARRDSTPAQVDAILSEPGVATGGFLLLIFGTALSIPFWHAPALVHWGGQGVAQSLFSSTLAVWRARGAFVGYFLGWLVVIAVFAIVTALLFGLFGATQMAGLVALPGGLMFTAVFYVSLLFTFNDSFGGAGLAPAAGPADNAAS